MSWLDFGTCSIDQGQKPCSRIEVTSRDFIEGEWHWVIF